jgi:hypothetical protein
LEFAIIAVISDNRNFSLPIGSRSPNIKSGSGGMFITLLLKTDMTFPLSTNRTKIFPDFGRSNQNQDWLFEMFCFNVTKHQFT